MIQCDEKETKKKSLKNLVTSIIGDKKLNNEIINGQKLKLSVIKKILKQFICNLLNTFIRQKDM